MLCSMKIRHCPPATTAVSVVYDTVPPPAPTGGDRHFAGRDSDSRSIPPSRTVISKRPSTFSFSGVAGRTTSITLPDERFKSVQPPRLSPSQPSG